MGKRWIRNKKKDYYYKKAKTENYRSRASYKLKQLNRKFRIIKKGDRVLELGSAPGGWTQVAREIVGKEGLIVAVDIEKMEPLGYRNVEVIQGDFTQEETIEKIKEITPYFDVVISDASPNISGVWDIDHFRSIYLCEKVLDIAERFLRPGGNMLFKVFQGEGIEELRAKVKERFKYVKFSKPRASRSGSAEIYVIGRGKAK